MPSSLPCFSLLLLFLPPSLCFEQLSLHSPTLFSSYLTHFSTYVLPITAELTTKPLLIYAEIYSKEEYYESFRLCGGATPPSPPSPLCEVEGNWLEPVLLFPQSELIRVSTLYVRVECEGCQLLLKVKAVEEGCRGDMVVVPGFVCVMEVKVVAGEVKRLVGEFPFGRVVTRVVGGEGPVGVIPIEGDKWVWRLKAREQDQSFTLSVVSIEGGRVSFVSVHTDSQHRGRNYPNNRGKDCRRCGSGGSRLLPIRLSVRI